MSTGVLAEMLIKLLALNRRISRDIYCTFVLFEFDREYM